MTKKRGPNQDEAGSDGIGDIPHNSTENEKDYYPLMKPYGGPYDIGITNITTSKTIVGQGYNLTITVKILNYGINTETFNITAYANTTIINQTQITLPSRNSTTITFTWNTTGFAYGNHTITAVADNIPGETATTDNTFVDGKVFVTIPGDINGDGDVDKYDFGDFALAYGSKEGEPEYIPGADLDEDGDVDKYDFGSFAGKFGQSIYD